MGVCLVFAGTPFLLKYLVLRSYGQDVGLSGIFGNGELCLMASLLSCSALLELFLARRSSNTEAGGLFVLTLGIAIFAIGYYAAVSRAFPNPQSANEWSVTAVSGATYVMAIVLSWLAGKVAEQGRMYGYS